MCVSIKLYTTAQPGPDILISQCYGELVSVCVFLYASTAPVWQTHRGTIRWSSVVRWRISRGMSFTAPIVAARRGPPLTTKGLCWIWSYFLNRWWAFFYCLSCLLHFPSIYVNGGATTSVVLSCFRCRTPNFCEHGLDFCRWLLRKINPIRFNSAVYSIGTFVLFHRCVIWLRCSKRRGGYAKGPPMTVTV